MIYHLSTLLLLLSITSSWSAVVWRGKHSVSLSRQIDNQSHETYFKEKSTATAQIGDLHLKQRAVIRPGRIIYELLLSPDGWTLAMTVRRTKIGEKENRGSREPLVQLWDTISGQMRLEFPRGEPWRYEKDYLNWWHKGFNNFLYFSPDSHWVLSLDRDLKAVIRDAQSGDAAVELQPGQKKRKYDSFAFDWNNWLLAVAPETSVNALGNKPVEVWEVKSGQLRFKIQTPSLDKDCRLLAWLLDRKRICLPHQADPVDNLIFLPNGSGLISFALWGRIYLWDTKTGEMSKRIFRESGGRIIPEGKPYTTVGFPFINPNGDLLATASLNGRVGFWSLPGMEFTGATTPPFNVGALEVVFSPNEQRLAIQGITRGYDECGVLLWNQTKMIPIETWEKLPRSLTIMFTPDSRTLIIAETDKKKRRPAKMYDANTGELSGEPASIPFLQAGFSNDGSLFYSLSWDQQSVTLWDVLPRS